MKRKIINIDESKCDGCGLCIPDCPEGALQIIDGKARLVSDLFCDGLGACIGTCPKGAIFVEEREAEPYDEKRVMRGNIIPKGENTIKAHLKHLKDHGETELLREAMEILAEEGISIVEEEPPPMACGCPGTMARGIERVDDDAETAGGPAPSCLGQWPVELRLVQPSAGYFKNSDLLVAADCAPFAYGDFHRRYLKGRSVVVFCPKLDHDVESYVEKLAELFRINDLKSITIARMQVPCCGGTEVVVRKALELSGKDIPVKIDIITAEGKVL
jgi:NAD-dependent dihydropyrimidine dehydrogenase PreA subunit